MHLRAAPSRGWPEVLACDAGPSRGRHLRSVCVHVRFHGCWHLNSFQKIEKYIYFSGQALNIRYILKPTALHGPCNQAPVSYLHKTSVCWKVLPCDGAVKNRAPNLTLMLINVHTHRDYTLFCSIKEEISKWNTCQKSLAEGQQTFLHPHQCPLRS